MFPYVSYFYLQPSSCPFQQKCKKLRTKTRRRHGFSTWRTPTELSTGRQVSHCPSTVLTTASHHHHSPFSLPLLHLASSYSFMFPVLAQTPYKINLTFNAFSYFTFQESSDSFTDFTFYQFSIVMVCIKNKFFYKIINKVQNTLSYNRKRSIEFCIAILYPQYETESIY